MKGNIGKIDMSLLTPGGFTKEAAKVGLTLSELIAKKTIASENGSDAAALELQKSTTDIFWFTLKNGILDNLANGTFGINEMVLPLQLMDAWKVQ
jgi:hypothetical protein